MVTREPPRRMATEPWPCRQWAAVSIQVRPMSDPPQVELLGNLRKAWKRYCILSAVTPGETHCGIEEMGKFNRKESVEELTNQSILG